MPYTAQFFAEKLNIPVEYFNPLRNIQIEPEVNLEELARVAHSLGEVVGLGLRNLAHCPVEMNLMPASTLRWQAFNEKKPYFIATVFSLVLVAFAVGFLYEKLAQSKEAEIKELEPKVAVIQAKYDGFKRVIPNCRPRKKRPTRSPPGWSSAIIGVMCWVNCAACSSAPRRTSRKSFPRKNQGPKPASGSSN
jgi:hypothetical protein